MLGISIFTNSMIVAATLIGSALSEEFRANLFSLRGLPFIFGGIVLLSFLVWVAWKTASVIRYAVREHDVILQTGIFWRKETVQPIARIQHVEQSQGPLDKRFGLYTLKLFSAGTGHVTFQIPGLDARTAARLRRFLLERARLHPVAASGHA